MFHLRGYLADKKGWLDSRQAAALKVEVVEIVVVGSVVVVVVAGLAAVA